MKKVSLYIPCFNSARTIQSCLESVFKQNYPLEEVIVIDDGSTDATAEIASGYPVRIISLNVNKGLAFARNLAVKSIKSEFAASLDADCAAGDNWLKNIMEAFDKEEFAGVGGKLIEQGDTVIDLWRRQHLLQNWGNDIVRNPAFLFGSNTVFRKDVLLEAGLYNEKFKTNYEDYDISMRMREKGYNLLYLPDALVYHMRNDTAASLIDTFWRWNLEFYESKNCYEDLNKLSFKMRDNMGLSNRFIDEDVRLGRMPLVHMDFLLFSALSFKDLKYFYKLQFGLQGNYNKKLISFLYILEQIMSLSLGNERIETALKKDYIAERAVFLLILFIGRKIKDKFPCNGFYKIWLRQVLILYFEDNNIPVILKTLIKLIDLCPHSRIGQLYTDSLDEMNKIIHAVFFNHLEMFFDNAKPDIIMESFLTNQPAV